MVAGVDMPISCLSAWRWRCRPLAMLEPLKPERLDGRHFNMVMERRSKDQIVHGLGKVIGPDSVFCIEDFSV